MEILTIFRIEALGTGRLRFSLTCIVYTWGIWQEPSTDEEPFANYGTSKWTYPEMWLYRSRGKHWVLSTEDPSATEYQNTDGSRMTPEEQAKAREVFFQDTGLYRTKDSGRYVGG